MLRRTLVALLVAGAAPLFAQRSTSAIRVDSLRANLFALAADSMGGRQTGSAGDWKAQEWVAAEFRAAGLEPAGEGGGYFQVIPFLHVYVDTAVALTVPGAALRPGRETLPLGPAVTREFPSVASVYGGSIDHPEAWIDSAGAAGRIVVFSVPDSMQTLRQVVGAFAAARANPALRGAAALAVAGLDRLAPDLLPQILAGRLTTDTSTAPSTALLALLITPAAARAVFGAGFGTAAPGTAGGSVSGAVRWRREPLAYPSRNIVGILRGSDPALRGEFVAISAHHDHVGFTGRAVDHDSVYATNRVLRPLGADSPLRAATPAESSRIAALRDSLRRAHPARADSVFNGADDDGSGTVALVAIARSFKGAARPRRSLLLISHAAEERGLLGSAWFSDHPTVARDSIVGEVDADMIGRGNATDLPTGGPGYLEVVGARRLSTEYGDLLEQVNRGERRPFTFNYEYDVPGHPLQYYCRADHYSYARYNIPSVSLSRGEHADYHQVTDEPQYIDYDVLGRVATLVRDFAVAVADLDHRPVVNGARQADPHTPCRQ